MNIYEFMSDSPYLTFFLAYIAAHCLARIVIFSINRPLRHMNIRKHGYPPPHCDADGDFVQKDGD